VSTANLPSAIILYDEERHTHQHRQLLRSPIETLLIRSSSEVWIPHALGECHPSLLESHSAQDEPGLGLLNQRG
jgi:hypothetical protein